MRAYASLLTAALSLITNSCGLVPATLGGISSSGDKPKPSADSQEGDALPMTKAPASAPAPAPAPEIANMASCDDRKALEGVRFQLIAGLEAAPDCAGGSVNRMECVETMVFAGDSVDITYVNQTASEALFALCAHDVQLRLETQPGVAELHRLALRDDGSALVHVLTGRVFERVD